jgi:hypothetical protein
MQHANEIDTVATNKHMNASHTASPDATAPMPMAVRNGAIKPLVCAWLAAGCFDILAAFLTSLAKGGTVQGVLKAIASGLLGAPAFRGGLEVAMLGLALHFAIMFVIVLVYFYASRYLVILANRPVVSGLAYGAAVYAVMNLIVLPLSAIAFKPRYTASSLAVDIPVHMICVGLTIAMVLHSFRRAPPPGKPS